MVGRGNHLDPGEAPAHRVERRLVAHLVHDDGLEGDLLAAQLERVEAGREARFGRGVDDDDGDPGEHAAPGLARKVPGSGFGRSRVRQPISGPGEGAAARAGDHQGPPRRPPGGPADGGSGEIPQSGRRSARIAPMAWAPWPIATARLGTAGRVTSPAAHTRGRDVRRPASTFT